jgi:hypothetical protein
LHVIFESCGLIALFKTLLLGTGAQCGRRRNRLTPNKRFELVPECRPEFVLGERHVGGKSDGAKL